MAVRKPSPINVTREEFDRACEAVWSEIVHQNHLARRTDGSEARDVPGFATLGRRYLRKLEENWSDNAGDEHALPDLRKLAAIFIRGMVYCGIVPRGPVGGPTQ